MGAARRFLRALLPWALLFPASPGVVTAEGSAVLALLGVAAWAWAVFPPPAGGAARAFLAELAAGGLGCAALVAWIAFVSPAGLVAAGLGMGFYVAVGGVLLRRLATRLPLPLAVALAWCGAEAMRAVPPPFGLGWLRLGHHAHHHALLAGSARVWGVEGLGLALAALAGLAYACASPPARRRLRPAALACGVGPLVLGLGLAAATAPPATEDGPRLLLVQPGFSQTRKMSYDPRANFLASRRLTLDALRRSRAAGEPPVDLVCWGESMLFLPLVTDGALAALEAGERPPPWLDLDLEMGRRLRSLEDDWVRGALLGLGAGASDEAFPPGTSFLSGADVYDHVGGELRRRNAVSLWDARGARSEPAGKRYLVTGAESLHGLERLASARRIAERLVGYLPDIVPAERTAALALVTESGPYRFGASVCFDNAFLAPYVEPTVGGEGVDFHLVASNEAWYRDTFEMDQMLAFSRVAALASGRALVRATNSGVSVAFGPDGRELGRVRSEGRDRGVAGTLALTVPVPVRDDGAGPGPTPYARLRMLWVVLLVGLPLLLAGFPKADRSTPGNPAPGRG